MKIIVLAGGLSPERDVSLTSGAGICKTLREKGHQAFLLDVFFGLPYDTDKLDEVFDLPGGGLEIAEGIKTTVPDLEALKKQRPDQSDCLIGPNVLELCKMADINRSTFYSYYEDVYALLTQIQNELFENIVLTLANDNWFNDILHLIDQNRDLCQVLIGPHGDSSFIRQLMYLGYDNSMRVWQKIYPNADATMLDYSYAYLANGVIGILENWVCSNYKLSIEQVGKLLMGITMNGLNFLEQGASAYEV